MATEFDFVIVGGGTAGLVLAARLSEDPNTQVLVMEAGEDLANDPRVNIPGMWTQLQSGATDWQLKSVPQDSLNGRSVPIAQGRLLGGCSALNAMNFVVPAKEDLDAWAELGNPGWDWDGFSRYLNKTHKKGITDGNKLDDDDGTIQVNIPKEETKWPQVWRDTWAGLGYPTDNDPYSGDIHGAVTYPDAIHPEAKTRSYAGNDYLGLARGRANLTVWTGVPVDKILFDNTTKDAAVATGVRYTTKDGNTSSVRARKEVVLSAGVFHSPKLLELSGIGNAQLLQSLGIDVVVDNPSVGENLQHHPLSVHSFETVQDGQPGFETMDALVRQDPDAIAAAVNAYKTTQSGPLSRSNCNTMAHLPFPGLDTEAGKHDAQSIVKTLTQSETKYPIGNSDNDTYTSAATALATRSLTDPSSASGYYVFIPCPAGPPEPTTPGSVPKTHITIATLLTRPLSRGSTHITSAEKAKPPVIDPRYLSHPADIATLARHVRFIRKTLTNQPPLADRLVRNTTADDDDTPKKDTDKDDLDLDRLTTRLRDTAAASTLYTSTCAMMPRAMGGVVDSELRVYGTRNLRVVDASVMPFITRGDTMATVYGIAEKAAEILGRE
ncbi:uncharacterized protein C8A04DRAFT_10074 [Dichotomopilus funicola]|uniref:GMC oxidoreductase n=1 Tax=Dichotomopilus funicola TaxID=1934379 RepID=A0AAN6ZR30_9PEZI|nr:hypothetical protein C8A04DRAFT_10074 [Dichotomopilus funicola]